MHTATASLRSLAAWSPSPLPTVRAPRLRAVIGDFDVQPWLRAAYRTATAAEAHPDAYAVVAAVGTLARLWSPTTPEGRRVAMIALLGNRGPALSAAAWVAALSRETIACVLRLALVECDLMRDGLNAVREALAFDGADGRALAVAWLERRDALASVVSMLRGAGRDGEVDVSVDPEAFAQLTAAVESLDRAAGTCASMWSLLDAATDASPHLRTVRWQYPNAWWGERLRWRFSG